MPKTKINFPGSITFNLTAEDEAAFFAQAAQEDRTGANVLRRLVRRYLDENGTAPETPVTPATTPPPPPKRRRKRRAV